MRNLEGYPYFWEKKNNKDSVESSGPYYSHLFWSFCFPESEISIITSRDNIRGITTEPHTEDPILHSNMSNILKGKWRETWYRKQETSMKKQNQSVNNEKINNLMTIPRPKYWCVSADYELMFHTDTVKWVKRKKNLCIRLVW